MQTKQMEENYTTKILFYFCSSHFLCQFLSGLFSSLGFHRFSRQGLFQKSREASSIFKKGILPQLKPPQLYKGGFEFSKFLLKGDSDFSLKKAGVDKIGGCFKKEGITYFHTNLFQCYLSLSVWCVSMCFVYLHHLYHYYLCFTGRTQSYWI